MSLINLLERLILSAYYRVPAAPRICLACEAVSVVRSWCISVQRSPAAVHAKSARARSPPAAYAPHSHSVTARASPAPESRANNGHHGEHE